MTEIKIREVAEVSRLQDLFTTGERIKENKTSQNHTNQKGKLDESGIEPETSPMLRERATNYATRPNYNERISEI